MPSFKEINVSNLGCKIYWKWDNVDKNWTYFTNNQEYDKILSKNFKKFNIIYPGEGFWAYCDTNNSINLEGTSYVTNIDNLTNGWNLVGFGRDVNISDLDLKLHNVSILWIYKNNKWKYWINDKNLSTLDKNYTIDKDEGVWIYKNK